MLLDSEGKRIAAKYYSDDWSTNTAKKDFEKAVFSETQKTNALGAVQYGKIEPYRTVSNRNRQYGLVLVYTIQTEWI